MTGTTTTSNGAYTTPGAHTAYAANLSMSKRLNSQTSPEGLQRSKMSNSTGDEGQMNQTDMPTMIKAMLDSNVKQMYSKIEESEANIKSAMEKKIRALEKEVAVLSTINRELLMRVDKLEKEQRRKKIVVTGLDCQPDVVADKMKNAMKGAGGAVIDLQDIRKIITKSNRTKFVATCASVDDKLKLMLAKRNLKVDGKPIFVDDDLTPPKQYIQYKARLFETEERKTGKKAAVAYRKVWIDGVCHEYDDQSETFRKK